MTGRWSGNKALLLAPVLIFFVDYHAPDQDFSFCLFHLLTGRHCYGCGLLRGLSAVLHLDLPAAWRLNPLNAVTIPLLGRLYIKELLILVGRGKVIVPVHPLPPREIGKVDRLEP